MLPLLPIVCGLHPRGRERPWSRSAGSGWVSADCRVVIPSGATASIRCHGSGDGTSRSHRRLPVLPGAYGYQSLVRPAARRPHQSSRASASYTGAPRAARRRPLATTAPVVPPVADSAAPVSVLGDTDRAADRCRNARPSRRRFRTEAGASSAGGSRTIATIEANRSIWFLRRSAGGSADAVLLARGR